MAKEFNRDETGPAARGEIYAVTLDFYQTLVRHRTGEGRGASLVQYLARNGLTSQPWRHRVLYDVFEFYGAQFRPDFSPDEDLGFWAEFTERLFSRLAVSGPNGVKPEAHAQAVRDLMGPSCLALFEDVEPTLEWLARRHLPVGIVSNWQCGLSHFCRELGILDSVRFVLASAEVGWEKPDRRIFELATEKMQVAPAGILHVGDHPVEDARASLDAGMQAALLVRSGSASAPGSVSISSLTTLRSLIEGGLPHDPART